MTNPIEQAQAATAEVFAVQVGVFCVALQKFFAEHTAKQFSGMTPDVVSVDPGGKKYIRIVRSRPDGTSRSVYCFIEVATGNILKAAGWKAPALNGPRGNIFGANILEGCGPYGVARFR